MAKRHHHKERSEHRSMSRQGHYEGAEPRRRQEMEDMGMISEDHSAVANLPQNVMMKSYYKETDYLPENLDDTIRGIKKQMDYDNGKRKQHFMPKKV